jgi:hypothetical protein
VSPGLDDCLAAGKLSVGQQQVHPAALTCLQDGRAGAGRNAFVPLVSVKGEESPSAWTRRRTI